MGYVIAGVIVVAVLYFVLRPNSSGGIKSIFKRGGGGSKQKH